MDKPIRIPGISWDNAVLLILNRFQQPDRRNQHRIVLSLWQVACSWSDNTHYFHNYVRSEAPMAPLELARHQGFGAKRKAAPAAWAKEELKRGGNPDGRPATYDTHIDNEWNPGLGIRKGWAVRS